MIYDWIILSSLFFPSCILKSRLKTELLRYLNRFSKSLYDYSINHYNKQEVCIFKVKICSQRALIQFDYYTIKFIYVNTVYTI